MKPAGATGSYEKFFQYLPPVNNIITISMVIIGLTASTTFHIEHYKEGSNTWASCYVQTPNALIKLTYDFYRGFHNRYIQHIFSSNFSKFLIYL
jgi:hypothetical protein